MSAQQKLLSTAQVAKLWGVDPRTVQRRADAGDLPFVLKMPGATGAYLFDAAEVENYAPAR